MKKEFILGISAYFHDSAAALICNGEIIAAAQEERFTRIKGDSSFPHNAVGFCLEEAEITIEQVDYIVFYEDSVLKFDRILVMTHLTSPMGFLQYQASMPKWLTHNLWTNTIIQKELGVKNKIYNCEHHMSHAASAFYPSSFKHSAILTIDGVGEWATTTYGVGKNNNIKLLKQIRYPNSLGLLYSAFTMYTGFRINFGEYKLMGLAPYGDPIYAEKIRNELIHICNDGSIILNQKYFGYTYSLKTINKKFEELFDRESRKPESKITKHEMDIAASIQCVTNEVILKMCEYIHKETGEDNLTLAGGVALNVASMGYIERKSPFERIWIQPAAGDAGGALGAALWWWHKELNNKRNVCYPDGMKGSFLGYDIKSLNSEDDIVLERMRAKWKSYDDTKLEYLIAVAISQNKVIGIAKGKMEWGPRALGNRSILASAIDSEMQSKLNLKIKFRESFRPFAPMVLKEDAALYFDINDESPYMLKTYHVNDKHRIATDHDEEDLFKKLNQIRSDIPAVTHVDYSARVQTIDKNINPFIYNVLINYKKITGCSVIVNTSFNVRGEPIVCSAEDAYRCFMATDIDCLVIGNRFLIKEEQDHLAINDMERQEWLRRFPLD